MLTVDVLLDDRHPLSVRYRVNSNCTRESSIAMFAGRIREFRLPFSQRLWMTTAISRSTLRVR